MKAPRKNPVAHFAIAPHAPEPVRQAYENFQRVSSEWQDARVEVEEVEVLGKAAIKQAHRAAALARVEGSAPPKVTADKVAAEEEQKLLAAQAEVAALAEALDETGNILADEIEDNKEAWLENLDRAEAEAVERLRSALKEARAAVATLKAARRAPEWLREFRAADAKGGVAFQYAGAALRMQVPPFTVLDSQVQPEALFAILDSLVDPPAPRKPRSLRTVPTADSSMSARR
jgi:hypothetical protein